MEEKIRLAVFGQKRLSREGGMWFMELIMQRTIEKIRKDMRT